MAANFDLLFDGPAKAKTTIVLAHGAGVGMDSRFMNYFAQGLGRRGYRVVRVEFPYVAAKRVTGVRNVGHPTFLVQSALSSRRGQIVFTENNLTLTPSA